MRHELAKELDLPHRIALSDEALSELMKAQPTDSNSLGECRNVPRRVINEHGERILAAVKEGLDKDPIALEHRRPSEETAKDRMRIDALWSVLSLHCLSQSISPMLVLSRADLARWYLDRSESKTQPLFKEGSWREEVVGKWFDSFLNGEEHLDVEFKDGRPVPGS
jgi:ribonuclease D